MNRDWDPQEPPFLSPAFKQSEDTSEVYTPSFDHNNEIEFRKQSPVSFIDQIKDVSAQKTTEPLHYRKRRNKFKQRQDETPYMGHLVVNNEGQHVLQPLYSMSHRGFSMPPPMAIVKGYVDEEEDKENVAPIPYYPTCKCQHHHSNMYYNPHGYYYAPASLYFSPKSDDSEKYMNKRSRKNRRKSRDEEHHYGDRRSHRVKSACVSNRIPVQIIPKVRDSRMQLHAYPLVDMYPSQAHAGYMKEPSSGEKEDPRYVKKLEYSADKIQISASKHKDSEKKRHKQPDRSEEVEDRSKDYFEIKRKDRKHTLSGQKRTYAELSANRPPHDTVSV